LYKILSISTKVIRYTKNLIFRFDFADTQYAKSQLIMSICTTTGHTTNPQIIEEAEFWLKDQSDIAPVPAVGSLYSRSQAVAGNRFYGSVKTSISSRQSSDEPR